MQDRYLDPHQARRRPPTSYEGDPLGNRKRPKRKPHERAPSRTVYPILKPK